MSTTIVPAYNEHERLALPSQANWTSTQAEAAAELSAGPRGGVIGPFKPPMYSPELLKRVQKTGEYLRYNTDLPKRLTELAILIVAKHWGQPVEWNIHYPIALDAGVKHSDIDAISVDEVPPSLDTDQRLVYDFCRSLLSNGVVDDVVYMRLEAAIGKKGVVDLTALCGYYALLAMVMNVARTPG